VTVDIRAVNHRYLDLKLRGPLSPALEDSITSRVRSTVERGSVSVTVHVVGSAGGATRFDTAAAMVENQPKVQAAFKTGAGVAWGDWSLWRYCTSLCGRASRSPY